MSHSKVHLSPNRAGFSLVELAVVIVIVGVLAAFGVPRYRDAVERTKAAEAFNYLAAVRSAQERHLSLKGFYAQDPDALDIQQTAPTYFQIQSVVTKAAGEVVDGAPHWAIELRRDAATSSYGAYNIVYTEAGHAGDENPPSWPGVGISDIPPEINPIGE